MREGSLEAPTRHPIAWQDPDFADPAKIEAELKRVFEICHGCRRCFNLCDSFPRLFDLIDAAADGEVDGVAPERLRQGGRGLHALRHVLHDQMSLRAAARLRPRFPPSDAARPRGRDGRRRATARSARQLVETDRNGKLGARVAPLANWAVDTKNHLTRPAMEKLARHRPPTPNCPNSTARPSSCAPATRARELNRAAPAFGRKAALYATCFVNYNNPRIGEALRAVLALNGVETEVSIPAAAACRSSSRATSRAWPAMRKAWPGD